MKKLMTIIIAGLIAVVSCIGLVGCNEEETVKEETVEKETGGEGMSVHFLSEKKCYKIKKYILYKIDSTDMSKSGSSVSGTIRITLTNGTEMLVNTTTVYIVKGTCPICGEN